MGRCLAVQQRLQLAARPCHRVDAQRCEEPRNFAPTSNAWFKVAGRDDDDGGSQQQAQDGAKGVFLHDDPRGSVAQETLPLGEGFEETFLTEFGGTNVAPGVLSAPDEDGVVSSSQGWPMEPLRRFLTELSQMPCLGEARPPHRYVDVGRVKGTRSTEAKGVGHGSADKARGAHLFKATKAVRGGHVAVDEHGNRADSKQGAGDFEKLWARVQLNDDTAP
jgi:hypothetical protein